MKVPNKPIKRELLAEGKDHQGQIGSMGFACKIAGSKLLVVLGHTKCGAVKGACDNVEMGNLTELLSKLGPAVYQETTTAGADKRNSSNEEFVENVATINVK